MRQPACLACRQRGPGRPAPRATRPRHQPGSRVEYSAWALRQDQIRPCERSFLHIHPSEPGADGTPVPDQLGWDGPGSDIVCQQRVAHPRGAGRAYGEGPNSRSTTASRSSDRAAPTPFGALPAAIGAAANEAPSEAIAVRRGRVGNSRSPGYAPERDRLQSVGLPAAWQLSCPASGAPAARQRLGAQTERARRYDRGRSDLRARGRRGLPGRRAPGAAAGAGPSGGPRGPPRVRRASRVNPLPVWGVGAQSRALDLTTPGTRDRGGK
jgi:hypothetical protein